MAFKNNYTSLLVNGADGWHDGFDSISYSFATGTTLPDYYDTTVRNGVEVWDILGDYAPVTQSVELTQGEKTLALRAIEAWNEVANINLVPFEGTNSATSRVVETESTARSYTSVLAYTDDGSEVLE